MSEAIKQIEAVAETARAEAAAATEARDAVCSALDLARADLARLDALPHLTADDLLSLENVSRYLRTLEAELPEREAAAAAALAALREAERMVDRAQSAAAVEESTPLASAIEKTAARAAEKLRAQLHGLAERVEDARRHASQAEDPTPMLPGGVWHFAQAAAAAEDGALLMAVGRALLALRETERAEAARAKEDARSEKEREQEEAARRAWDALPAASKVDAFDRAVDDFRSRFPGYQLDAARRIVAADASANPYGLGGFNPHAIAIPVELDDAAELRRMRESIALRGEPDPAA